MNINRNLVVAVRMTVVTTLLLGIVYPLVVTGLAQALFRDKANGQLIVRGGQTLRSVVLGKLDTDAELLQPRLPDAGAWHQALDRAGKLFGVTVSQWSSSTGWLAKAPHIRLNAPVSASKMMTR